MDFLAQARAMQPALVEWFETLHRFPEPSRAEFRTNRLIRQALDARGIPYLAPAENITVAVIQGAQPGKTVGLRCDTDALQLQELTDLPYRSEVDGMMHACGHDAHTAAGLGAAHLLHAARETLSGTVKVIFQPAEEGELGAQAVLDTGCVNDVDAFFGLHVSPDYPTGTLLCAPGPICACPDMFTIALTGKGGHGAYPHLCLDPVAAGAALVQSLQHIVTRFTDPLQPVVLSVCTFHAGTRCNIIADQAILEGTVRTFDMGVRDQVTAHMRQMVEQIAAVHGCTGTLELRKAADVVVNDESLARLALESARRFAPNGPFHVQPRTMMGDDFADYARIAPSCYAQVGVADPKKAAHYAQHHALFEVDEEALPILTAWLCQFAWDVAARPDGA